MLTGLKKRLLPWTPPAVLNWYLGKRPLYTGDYPSWQAAVAASQGYDHPAIFQKVRTSAALVRDEKAAYERDGVTFEQIEHSSALLAALLHVIAGEEDHRLCVMDIGGGLGSSYQQCKAILNRATPSLGWNIVEQAEFVATGQREFTTDQLHFHESMSACLDKEPVNVALLSCVLPYLPKPHEMLRDLVSRRIQHVILDRTPLVLSAGRDLLTVQHVPAEIYGQPVHYPAWFFDLPGVMAHFEKDYDLVFNVDSLASTTQVNHYPATSKALYFSLRTQQPAQ